MLWSTVLTTVERERCLLSDILRVMAQWKKSDDDDGEIAYMRGRSAEWVREWRGTKGEIRRSTE